MEIKKIKFDQYVLFLPEGRKHDAGMLADSGLLRDLENHAFSPTGNPMALYGDPAYPLRVHLVVPYRAAGITPQMEEFNKAMSSVRISVEWLFGDIINYFKFVDFKKTQKISLASLRSDDGGCLGRQAEVKLLPELLPADVVVKLPAVAALSVT